MVKTRESAALKAVREKITAEGVLEKEKEAAAESAGETFQHFQSSLRPDPESAVKLTQLQCEFNELYLQDEKEEEKSHEKKHDANLRRAQNSFMMSLRSGRNVVMSTKTRKDKE